MSLVPSPEHGTADYEELMQRMELAALDGKLDVSGLTLYALPALPPTLLMLNVSNTNLAELPPLPQRLWMLDCAETRITRLPPLPASLRHLNVSGTPITVLPSSLPDKLTTLICSDMPNLTVLPQLPSNLQSLDCSRTKIVVLPALPASLRRIECEPLPKPTLLYKTHSFSNSIGFI